MAKSSFGKQTNVYFKKITRISLREKAWKFVVFAVIISGIVAAVTGDKMFDTFESTKSGFFTLVSACVWIGLFNSIQSVCKEHHIVRSEYREGMRLGSYIMAQTFWQFLLSFVQTIVIFVVSYLFMNIKDSDGVLGPAAVEYFVTMFLLVFGSAVLGIMVSSIAGNPTTAMTIMPFVLILQLIMSGVLFELEGIADKVAYITYSKWGMSAFGCIGDINSPDLPLAISREITQITIEHSAIEDCYIHDVPTLFTAWGWCIGIIIVCILVSILSLKIRNRDS